MDDGGPIASLIKHCQSTSSQEEDVLRTSPNCPFASESEIFSDGSPSSEPFPTLIVMVSPPDSPKDEITFDEVFQTPPEDSLLASSEEQKPPTAAAGPLIDGVNGVETMTLDGGYTEAERAVDLGKDLDNLGFSGVKSTQVIEGSGGVSGVDRVGVSEVFKGELGKFRVLQIESNLVSDYISFESVPKKLKVSDKNLGSLGPLRVHTGDDYPVITETNCIENASTELLDLEVEEIGEGLREDTMTVDLPLKETEKGLRLSKSDEVHKKGDGGSSRKNIEDLDKFKYVSSRGANGSKKVTGVGGRREKPSTFSVLSSNAVGQTVKGTSAANNQILKNLLDALKMVAGELDDGPEEQVDFLETAKRCGMTFPQPRWGPPDGYDD